MQVGIFKTIAERKSEMEGLDRAIAALENHYSKNGIKRQAA
jgi:hypothetical protein